MDGRILPHHDLSCQQMSLPVKMDAKRPSDRIRARIYFDGRLESDSFVLAMVLAEHVAYGDLSYSCELTQATLARWSHMSVRSVQRHLKTLLGLGVIEISRSKSLSRYVFLGAWVAQWQPSEQRGRPVQARSQDTTTLSHLEGQDTTTLSCLERVKTRQNGIQDTPNRAGAIQGSRGSTVREPKNNYRTRGARATVPYIPTARVLNACPDCGQPHLRIEGCPASADDDGLVTGTVKANA